jgi:hypothetical protein
MRNADKILVGNLKVKDKLGDLQVGVRVIQKLSFEKEVRRDYVNWLQMCQWWALVNTEMNLGVP